jgi:hypothetical protein
MIEIWIDLATESKNFFALKQYKTIANRYDKRAINFLDAVYLATAIGEALPITRLS